MINKYFVWKKRLFSKEELLSMAAIAQSTPGAIAVNLSALAGHRTAGMAGVICSCLGAIIPPLVILSIITVWYDASVPIPPWKRSSGECRQAWRPSLWT